ncbi:L,D-transpeptidase [Paenibacillus sanguinis]|uniref:L,D-transpeptidase n=1 Tax=Paenibacillus sanguinis TaxID=225906 RepID=UPI000367ACE0|nr:L,D-transpeptidase family protein [Paenibacillus sanguinis]
MGDSAYLKKYVEDHPNNKMAWYLLGKEYEASGQEGKAHYCYIQAGNIYEAFEASKMPSPEEVLPGYEAGLAKEKHRRQKRSGFLRKLGLALLLLLLIQIPSAHAPGEQRVVQTPLAPQKVETPTDEPETVVDSPEMDKPIAPPVAIRGPVFTAAGYGGGSEKRQQAGLSSLLALRQQIGASLPYAVVLGMEPLEDYLVWTKNMPVVVALEEDAGSGQTTLQSYDREACLCTPPDSSELQAAAAAWIPEQESLGVLRSAMLHYKQAKGQWPESLETLAGSYPNNWIAGTDEVMEQAFKPLLAQLGRSPSVKGDAVADEGASAILASGMAPGQPPYFSEPLEIIVDTDNYKLAVISGDKLIRSYTVGLGGERTPEGTYAISEKVVNPNGRDNGEFGSRGMQLSDTNYAIHGTNEPDSIGKDESLGCIRMTRKDVEELFDLVTKGTKVTIGKGILPTLESVPKERFTLGHRQDQTNPHRTYRWLD